MEPVITSVLAALAAGAVAASKDVATAAIKDSYNALKNLIVKKSGTDAAVLTKIEADPSDAQPQADLAGHLRQSGLGTDPELKTLTKALLDALAELRKDPRAQPLFDYDELEVARDFKMTNITSARQIMRAGKVKVHQDFIVDNIRDAATGAAGEKKA